MPAHAGIQYAWAERYRDDRDYWVPAFAGTTFRGRVPYCTALQGVKRP
jgi:hypothetical protein